MCSAAWEGAAAASAENSLSLLLCSARSSRREEQPWCSGSPPSSESSEIAISPLSAHPAPSHSCNGLQLTPRARLCFGIPAAIEEKRFPPCVVNWTDTSTELLMGGVRAALPAPGAQAHFSDCSYG